MNEKETNARLINNSSCMSCDSYEDGWCTNFGKEVNAKELCEYYRRTVLRFGD